MVRLLILVLFTVCQVNGNKTKLRIFVITTQDISKIPIATEQEDSASSNAACCDDVDDNVLSDEALDKLDKELEAESSDEMELGVNRTGDMPNGTGEEEVHEVVSFSY